MALSVLTVARTLPRHIRGGMEETAWSLAKAMARLGAHTTILTTSFDHGGSSWSDGGVTVHEIAYVPERLRGRPAYRWWPHFGAAAADFTKTRGLSVDVIHVHSMYADGFLAAASHAPVVLTAHGTPLQDYDAARDALIAEVGRYHPRVLLQRLAVGRAERRMGAQVAASDAVVAVSDFVASHLPGVSRAHGGPHVIPNGIDPERFPLRSRRSAREALRLPADAKVLLYLGRIEAYKGVAKLVDALPSWRNTWLLVAGSGPYLEALRAAAKASGSAERIRILGPVEDRMRPDLYAAADLFCLPSRNEGQPVTLLESMAMGTPVATTRDWVPDALHRYAVIDEDAERMIARGLELSARLEPSEVREAVLSKFTWSDIARTYLDLFQRLQEANR